MMRDLEWLGLGWDDEPVFQSSRHALYQEALELLSKLSFDEISDIISTSFNDSKPCSTTAATKQPPLRQHRSSTPASARAPTSAPPLHHRKAIVSPCTQEHADASSPANRSVRNNASPTTTATRCASPPPTPPSPSTTKYSAPSNTTSPTTSATSSCAARTASTPTSWPSPWTTSTWASPTLCAAVICFAPTLCKSTFAKALINAGFKPSEPTQPFHPADGSNKPDDVTISYAHLPLIDNAAGQRLAKRERSLDLGILTAHGATAQQIIGYCAWLLGLQGNLKHTKPQPMSADEALGVFSWDAVRTNTSDRTLDQASSTHISDCRPYSAVLFCSSIPQSRSANP